MLEYQFVIRETHKNESRMPVFDWLFGCTVHLLYVSSSGFPIFVSSLLYFSPGNLMGEPTGQRSEKGRSLSGHKLDKDAVNWVRNSWNHDNYVFTSETIFEILLRTLKLQKVKYTIGIQENYWPNITTHERGKKLKFMHLIIAGKTFISCIQIIIVWLNSNMTKWGSLVFPWVRYIPWFFPVLAFRAKYFRSFAIYYFP